MKVLNEDGTENKKPDLKNGRLALEEEGGVKFYRYHPFTDEEIAAIAEEEARIIAESKAAAEREAFLADAPSRIEGAELALAELGEIDADNASTIEELAQAVAELGAIIAG